MDILYYSNYCKHSQKIVQYLVKGNLANQLNFLCIDKRTRDPNSNQLYILLENGQKVIMPPNVQSVPALLLVKHSYRVILGDDIITHFQSAIQNAQQSAGHYSVEPTGVSLMSSNQGMNIISEPYTFYSLTSDELSAKGVGGRRQMYNYVSANQNTLTINTPAETYQADKISGDITIDTLQQKRQSEIQQSVGPSPFVPKV
jgi:hypothetical protein